MRATRAILVAMAAALAAAAAAGEVRLEPREGRVDVTIDGEAFTSYVFAGHRKPILFPIVGPTGAGMTRRWPMVEGAAGEPHDHPHHESLWFTHGAVNGVDFWTSHPRANQAARRDGPRVEHVAISRCAGGVLETENRWVRADGGVVCTDTRRLSFAGDAEVRTIDYSITIHANHGPVTFGDTKEGTMALRVPTPLQLKDLDGSAGAAGHCVNSAGDRDADVWGKRARWVDYWGPIEGRTAGVAVLDHPRNLRHPTSWHARDYGLVAANPFGLHDFTGAKKGAGDHVIPAGGSLTLRYLFVFHEGDAAAAGIADRWTRWSAAGEAGP